MFVVEGTPGRRSLITLALTLALLPVATIAQDRPGTVRNGLPPAPDATTRAAVVFAPYRYGDILWENDRTAHRIYGRPLEKAEPPSSSGIDAWGKNVRWPFMDRQLRTGDQHANHGEGIDFYGVHSFRGAGGLGVWYDNKLWVSRNYARYRILQNGPDTASFSVDYDRWPVDVVRKVWETRRFTLPAGTNFTRMVSTLNSDKPGELVVGIGISKHPTDETRRGTLTVDRSAGRLTWWGPTDPAKGTMGVALLVDPAAIVDVTADADNYLVLLRATPGRPFVYYMGAAWDRGLDVHSEQDWLATVRSAKTDFRP